MNLMGRGYPVNLKNGSLVEKAFDDVMKEPSPLPGCRMVDWEPVYIEIEKYLEEIAFKLGTKLICYGCEDTSPIYCPRCKQPGNKDYEIVKDENGMPYKRKKPE